MLGLNSGIGCYHSVGWFRVYLELTLIVGSAGLLDPMSSQGGFDSYWMRTCCFSIFLIFFEHIHGCVKISVKKFLRVKVSLWKTSLCNNFCVWKFLCVKVLRSKTHWYLQHFLRFCIVPAKHVKTPKFCNSKHVFNFEKLNAVRNMCQNGFFSDSSSKKLPLRRVKDFWCFSGPGVGGSAAWGAPHHRALVALGRS